MKKCFLVVLIFLAGNLLAQSGTDILKKMHEKYFEGPCRSYTFSQKNTHYRNDSITGHSEWHEAVEFPDKFRINFGKQTEGNFVVFKNDSVFNYRGNKLSKTRADTNTLLLILGGMYYRDLENVFARLKNAGYNLNEISSNNWEYKGNKTQVHVIGAKENDLNSNQIWVDKKSLKVLRIIEKLNDKETTDMRFESHQSWCKGYVETKVSFRRNGKLEQVEEYYDIKKASAFSE